MTYQEDKSLVRTGNAPRVMASLRSLAISLLRLDGHANIAAANRHHARDPQRTLKAASDRMNDFAGSLGSTGFRVADELVFQSVPGSVRGSPNRGITLAPKPVTAVMRSPAIVTTSSP